MTIRTASRLTARLRTRTVVSRRLYSVAELGRALMKDLFNPYRPERHYMRGPGPKWREKQARAHSAGSYPTRELARARI